jgi:hypothetical protein
MEDNKKRKRPLITPTQNKSARRGKPVTKVPNLNNITSNVKKERKSSNDIEKYFTYKDEDSPRKNDSITNQVETSLETYNEPIVVPTNEWKQTFRKTDSIELASLIQNTSVSHNSLLRLTGSYSTKMLSNIKLNNRELSGIETRPTKVFYNQHADLREAITTNILSYIPYILNYLSTLENDTTKQTYIDNLYLLNEKLYFSLFLYKNTVIETECIVLTKENQITDNFKIKDSRNSLKIFITEEKNNEEMLSTIMQEMKQNFIFLVLNRTEGSVSLQMYNQTGKVPFSLDNLRRLNKDKVTKLKDDKEYDGVKAKYNRGK